MSKKKRLLSLILGMTMVITMMPWSAIISVASFSGSLQFNANGKFTIMQVCDIQDDQNVDSTVISAITNNIARYHPDLVVFNGDNIIESISSVSNFQSSVNQFLAPLISSGTKFAVTFGNHDSEGSGGSQSSQYAYYKSHGGDLFIDQDVAALDGDASGVIPIYPNGQTSGTPAYQVYVMDSGHNPSAGSYDSCYTSQIDYYIQRSQLYPTVPSIWFQHVIVPDIYTRCMTTTNNGTTGYTGNGTPFSSNTYYIDTARINYARSYSTNISDMYKEKPCPSNQAVYEATAHRSSATYGSKTLYEAWRDYGNFKGAYFGHDHLNKFTCTTSDGIDLGYGKGTTMYKTAGIINYNDGNPGCSIYQLDISGSYTNEYSTNVELANDAMVTFDANGGLGTVRDQWIAKNSSATLHSNAFTKVGYSFTGWNTKADGTGTSYVNSANYSIGSSDVTLYAKWLSNATYNITFDANGGSGGTGPTAMNYGMALTAPSVTRTGYILTGWSPVVPSTVPSADTTYTAQWAANTYTVNYNGNGSTSGSTANSSHTYDVSSNLTGNGFSKIGSSFLGWSASSSATLPTYTNSQSVLNLTSTPNAVVTFYAVWAINQYSVTFNSNGGSSVTTITQTYNTSANKPSDPIKTGYTFNGWYSDAGLTTAVTWPYTIGPSNVTFYAKWNTNSYTITFDASGGTGGTSSSKLFGTSLSAPSVTKFGYTLTGWSPEVPALVPASDTTYTAQWSAKSYTITFDANGGTGGTGGPMAFGASLSAPSVSRTGYSFTGWSPSVPSTVPAADTTYIAQWSTNSYNITFNANGGTGGTSASMQYGAALSSPAVIRVGYILMGWSPEVPLTVPGADTTYVAQWTLSSNNVIINANGGDGGTSITLSIGSPITSPSVAKDGYLFTGWLPALPSTVVGGLNTYTAQWFINSYLITFDANGGTGSTSVLKQYGSSLTAPTVSRAGFSFAGWSSTVPASVPASNTTFIAQWVRNKVEITFDANGGTGGTIALMTYGDQLTPPAVSKTGYIFTGWSPAVPSKVVEGSHIYTATWMAAN